MAERSLSGSVYIIEDDRGLVKIGQSANPKKRIDGIRSGFGIEVVDAFVSEPFLDYKAAEKTLHAQFVDSRQEGEWFSAPFSVVLGAALRIGMKEDYNASESVCSEIEEGIARFSCDAMERLSKSSSIKMTDYRVLTFMTAKLRDWNIVTETQQEIADRLCMSRQAVTSSIANLESIGLVKKLDVVGGARFRKAYFVNPNFVWKGKFPARRLLFDKLSKKEPFQIPIVIEEKRRSRARTRHLQLVVNNKAQS